ncbi:MAG: APC family permease, partial [Planctomycetota bacterium]
MNDDTGHMERQLGLWDVFAIAAGAMISSGLFVLPGLAYANTGPSVVLAYALAAMLYLPSLFSQVELASAMPRSGGSYFSVERSLGSLAGTVAGLVNWISIALKAAFALVGLGTLAQLIFPGAGSWLLKGTAAAAAVLFAVLNLFSSKESGRLQRLMVFVLLGILAVYILVGFRGVDLQKLTPFTRGETPWLSFFGVTAMIFVSFGGLNAAMDVSGEVRQPGRNIPIGMFLAFFVVNAVYILAVFVTVGLLGNDLLGAGNGSLTPIADGAKVALGMVGLVGISAASFLAYATTGNAGIMSASRSPMAMSRDGLLPAALSKTHPKLGTPVRSIVLTAVFIMAVVTLLEVEQLVKTASTMLLLSFAMVNLAVIVMRKVPVQGYRPTFRAPLAPWLQVASIILYVVLIAEMGWVPLLVTAGALVFSLLWYLTYVHWRIDRESAIVYMVKSILSKHIGRSRLEDELVAISLERDDMVTDRFDRLVRDCPVLDIDERIDAREFFSLLAEKLAPRLHKSREDL